MLVCFSAIITSHRAKMLTSTVYNTLRLFAMVTMTSSTVAWLPRDGESLSCLEARVRCEADVTCRVLLETIGKVCDTSVDTCQTSQRLHCHSILTALQSNIYFKNCVCDRFETDATECVNVHQRIFLHLCVKKDDTGKTAVLSSHNDVSWTSDTSTSRVLRPDELGSCLDYHRQCQSDPKQCVPILNELRQYCRNRKPEELCSSEEWKRCKAAMVHLTEILPELLTCVCPMQETELRHKCERVRWRVATNITCTGSVNMFSSEQVATYSPNDVSLPYADIASLTANRFDVGLATDSCLLAFVNCHANDVCQSYAINMFDACATGTSVQCVRRHDCQVAVERFYRLVPPHLAQSFLFCQCHHPNGQQLCQNIRNSFILACSQTDLTIPSCHDVIDECNASQECRGRLGVYSRHCVKESECQRNPSACRNALVKLVGSRLTARCVCVPSDRELCNTLPHRISEQCIETVANNFYQVHSDFIKSSLSSAAASDDNEIHKQAQSPDEECRRVAARLQKTSSSDDKQSHFQLIRFYRRNSSLTNNDCSELCLCDESNHTSCSGLPCPPSLSCKYDTDVYVHGAAFAVPNRGMCRCFKAEIICAKTIQRTEPKPGLFLHVGYSLIEQTIIDTNSPVRFQPVSVEDKLSSLLNANTSNQPCRLTLFRRHNGNLVFELVNTSRRIHKSSAVTVNQVCMASVKVVSELINSRDGSIISDVELSLLKVAQLERVQFHNHRTGPLAASSLSVVTTGASYCASLHVLLTTVTLIVTVTTTYYSR